MDLSSLDVLCCQIRIGDADEHNPMKIINPIILTEVQNIEINESYKKLINTAKVTFPKGTVFRSTLIGPTTLEGKDASRITTEIMENGVIIEKRSNQAAMDKDTIKVGQRINIKIGYNAQLKNKFDGYITEYNSDSLFEVKCENMAHKLKLKQAPKFETTKSTKVNDVLGGKYKLLEGTGFEIHSETKRFDIDIGKIKVTDNFTVADILENWSKFKVYCFLKYDENSLDEMPRIAIGRPYSSSKSQPTFPDSENIMPYKIYFNYHVAASDLKVVKVDSKFLAVKAQALGSDEKFFEATIRLNPDYDPEQQGSKEFQTINATQISKKSHKITGNVTATGAITKTKVDLSNYTVVPYMSPNMRINSDTLVEEAIEYFKNYNLNGVSGTITLFGDFGLSTAVQVELIDNRNKSKNGTYIVEEVTTNFGTQGYRQKLTLPYRIRGEKTTYGKQEN